MPRKNSGQLVEREFLTIQVWDQLDQVTCEHVALAVEKCLPEPWKFRELAWHECGGQKRWVAFYTWKKPGRFQEATFALIPGGEVELGYDPNRGHKIPKQQLRGWRGGNLGLTSKENSWEIENAKLCTQLRLVSLEPYLIETHPLPKVRVTGKSERNRIRKLGMRLPTINEWEFACSAGTRSIWFWGDKFGKGPPKLNAFGLSIAQDAYQSEPVEEGTELRGGDSGIALHRGMSELEQFCAHSTWRISRLISGQENWWQHMRWRRVFPLPSEMLG